MSDAPVVVPVPGTSRSSSLSYGAPLGYALDLVALRDDAPTGAGTRLDVEFYAFSNPTGAEIAVAVGAFDKADVFLPNATSPLESWRGDVKAPCRLGPTYTKCTATIDLTTLPNTTSTKVGLMLKVAPKGPAHVYLDDFAATLETSP